MKEMKQKKETISGMTMKIKKAEEQLSIGINKWINSRGMRARGVASLEVRLHCKSVEEDFEKEFSPRKWQWAYPVIEGVGPCPRGGHTATLSGTSIIIFGGHYYEGEQKGYIYLNDTYVLDVNANKFNVKLTHKLRNPKHQGQLRLQGMLIALCLQAPRSSFLEEKAKREQSSEICMHLIPSI